MSCEKDTAKPNNKIKFPVISSGIEWGMKPGMVYDIMTDAGYYYLGDNYTDELFQYYDYDKGNVKCNLWFKDRVLNSIYVYYVKETPEVNKIVDRCLAISGTKLIAGPDGKEWRAISYEHGLEIQFVRDDFVNHPGYQWYCMIHIWRGGGTPPHETK